MATNNPFVVITNINVRLTVKEKTDGGQVNANGGASGVFVPFNKVFLDVRSITVSAKRQLPDDPIAIYDFGDELDGGFTVYLLKRSDGTYLNSGEVSWTARGV